MWFVLLALFATTEFPQKEFRQRLDAYLKIRQQADKKVPSVPKKAEPEHIRLRQVALARELRRLRSEALHGDIFSPPVQRSILRIIRTEMKGKAGEPSRKTVQQGNPAKEGVPVPLKVNADYPDKAPMSSMPPTLLLRLPQLPKPLDYRFVGSDLVLTDTDANIILDFIPNALP